MKAWLLDQLGDGIDKLHLSDVPDPQPASGEIVLRLLAAALNPADRYLAENQYPARPSLPHILGRDGVGIIESVGAGVDEGIIGQKRVVLPSEIGADRPGTFAERVAIPLHLAASPPPRWSDPESAAAPLVYLTAWQALTQWGELDPGVVLITGASGGVGVASVQLAKSLGHTVIALSRDPAKTEQLHALGADHVLDPQQPDWRKQMIAATGGRRVDLAVDNIGGALFNTVIDSMGQNGRISVVGRLAGLVPQFNTSALLFRRLRIGGVVVTGYSIHERQSVWTQITTRLAASGIQPPIDSVHSFADLPAAFARLGKGPMGKVVLRVADK